MLILNILNHNNYINIYKNKFTTLNTIFTTMTAKHDYSGRYKKPRSSNTITQLAPDIRSIGRQ